MWYGINPGIPFGMNPGGGRRLPNPGTGRAGNPGNGTNPGPIDEGGKPTGGLMERGGNPIGGRFKPKFGSGIFGALLKKKKGKCWNENPIEV